MLLGQAIPIRRIFQMPRQAKGKVQFATQVRAEVAEMFRAYYEGRGESLSEAVERALLREMRTPPPMPPEPPPLAPYDAALDGPPPAKPKKPRAKK